MLREGFAGRPRGKKPGAAIRLAVHRARKRKAKLIDNGVKPGLAGKQAAEEAIKHLKKRGYRPIEVPRFQRLMERAINRSPMGALLGFFSGARNPSVGGWESPTPEGVPISAKHISHGQPRWIAGVGQAQTQ